MTPIIHDGRPILNISLFEPMLAILAALTIFRIGIHRFLTRYRNPILALITVSMLTVLHAYYYQPEDPYWYAFWLKGYGKMLAIYFDIFCLYLILRHSNESGKFPLTKRGFIIFLVLYTVLTAFLIAFVNLQITVPRTAFVANVLGLFFFYTMYTRAVAPPSRREQIALGFLIVAASLLVLSKVGVMILGLYLIILVARKPVPDDKGLRIAALAGFVTVIVAFFFILPEISINSARFDSAFRSMMVRLDLWEQSLIASLDKFPNGIGAGLLRQTLQAIDHPLYYEKHLYVHSLPISLIAELGILGLVIAGSFLYFLIQAGRHYARQEMLPLYIAIVLPLCALHDIQSHRLFLLIMMFGFVGHQLSRSSKWQQSE